MTAPEPLSALGRAALRCAQEGWPVFPVYGIREGQCTCGKADCEHPGKHPRTDHGWKDASTNKETIRAWWTRWPDANIGHPTGPRVVLDVDGTEGEAALAALEAEHRKLPATLTARSGRKDGHHYYFASNGAKVRNSAGKLGPHLDVRGEGGYSILPPSVHQSGNKYQWINRVEPAPLPAWVAALVAESARTQTEAKGEEGKIPEGQRNAHLTSLAGSMRKRGMSRSAIEAALLAENKMRCDPPLAESEVKRIGQSVARYETGTMAGVINPWASAEGMDAFLAGEEDDAEFLDDGKRFLARECVAEIFSPRGLGKSLLALWFAVQLALRGLRVLYIDRDNPRRMIRARLRSFGALLDTPNLKVITREKCPPLTNVVAWANFPYSDYDVVIVDSLDSTAEGVGEQDSAKPSRAIAPLLDISRREHGPAVLVLGNCIKSAAHSRGSGVIEDRADIVYEVRDASGLKPSGSKPWWEELPPADAGSWANRASRRKQREKYRLAFTSSKFRIGQEPEPFILELDLTREPWTVTDVTDDVDRQGAEARQQRARERAESIQKAVAALVAEISRRNQAGEPGLLKKQAEEFLMHLTGAKITQKEARGVTGSETFILVDGEGKGHPKVVQLAGKKNESNRNRVPTEAAQTPPSNGADFRCPPSMHPTEIDPCQARINGGSEKGPISVNDSPFTPPTEATNEADEEVI